MALSATFTANFSSFYDAVAKAEKVLVDFGDGADKVGDRLESLTTKFSGKKIIQDATLMAKAVEDIGGTSMLTEKEMARLGATAQEAVAKMKALGMEVPQNLQKIADETKGANKATTDWMGSITKIAATLGIAFGVDAIKNFIASVFDAAGAVQDLSQQWGVSTKFVQQWTAAAKLSGIESEKIGKTIQFMTEKLSESSPEYQALIKNIGLSSTELRKMSTEDAYKTIIDKIAGIKDETLQLDVAMGILGPDAKKIIGGIRDGMYEAADAQKYMSDETIKRLAAAGDAWDRFKNNVIIYSGEMIAAIQKTTESATRSWGNFFKYVGLGMVDAALGTKSAEAFVKNEQAADKAAKAVLRYNDAAAEFDRMMRRSGDAIDEYSGGLGVTVFGVNALADSHTGLTGKIKTTAEVEAENKKKADDLKDAEEKRTKALEAAKKAQDDWNKRLQAEYNAVIDLKDAWSGSNITLKALQYVEALKTAIPIGEMTLTQQDAIHKVMEDAIEVYNAAGKEAPEAMYKIWAETVQAAESTETYQEKLDKLAATIKVTSNLKVPDLGLPNIALAGKPGVFDGIGKDLVSSLSGSILRAIEGGGNVFEAAGSSIGSFLLDPKKSGVGKAIEGAAQKLPGLLGSAISGAIPVVGALIGPAIGWLGDKIAGLFGKKEYEKLRDSFIQAAGGVEALTVATRAAGTNLDALFQARSTDAVNKAMADINTALTSQADAYQVALETAQKYGFTIEELGPAMARQELDKKAQELYKDWQVLNAAGIDTVAITTRMSESVSKYVQDAVKMGSDVPMAMKPMIEKMIESGTLLDENGNAITNLEDSGISFAMSMSDGFKALIDQVSKLTDAISRSLGLAIKNVPDLVVKGKVVYEDPGPPVPKSSSSGEAKPLASYQGGTDGFRNFGAGTPVMLHGWEAVVPREDAGAFATVAASSGGAPGAAAMPAIIINAQGAFFDTPESLQRLANKVSDALTAKYSVMGKLRAAV